MFSHLIFIVQASLNFFFFLLPFSNQEYDYLMHFHPSIYKAIIVLEVVAI